MPCSATSVGENAHRACGPSGTAQAGPVAPGQPSSDNLSQKGRCHMKNPFVFACITPHGLPIVETLSPDHPSLMAKTRNSMERLGSWMTEANPEVIVILTPHGLQISGMFTVVDTSYMSGSMSEATLAAMSGEQRAEPGAVVSMTRQVDRDLAKRIISAAKEELLPVAAANFATAEGPFSTLALDWGVLVPLAFMPEVPIVVITPSRRISDADHVRFGESLAQAVHQSGKRVGLIASCDWSHALAKDGPYGYHEDAPKLDKQVVDLLKTNEIEQMMDFPKDFISNAKPDGIWQSLILAGAIPRDERNSTFLSYEAPTYFGLMCVAYH